MSVRPMGSCLAADHGVGGDGVGKKCLLLIEKATRVSGYRALPIPVGVKPKAGPMRYRKGLLDRSICTSIASPQCPPFRQRLSLGSPPRPSLVSARAGRPCTALHLAVGESLSPPQPALVRTQQALPLDRHPSPGQRVRAEMSLYSSLTPSSSRPYDYKCLKPN